MRPSGPSWPLISLNIARLIQDLYLDGVSSGIFREIDPDEAVNLIGQQLYGVMAVRAGNPLPQPAAVVASSVCTFILQGLER